MTAIPRRLLALPLAALVAAASLIATEPAARACSCAVTAQILAPQQNAANVPVNARLWVKLAARQVAPDTPLTITLTPSTATVGSFSDITLSNSEVLRSYELQGLTAGTQYTATLATQEWDQMTVTFTVAPSTSLDGPEVPLVTSCVEDKEESSLFGGISSCGEWHKVDIRARAPGAAVVLSLRDGDGELDESGISGKVTTANAPGQDAVAQFYMGTAPCGPVTWNTSEGSTNLRVASYDITGKFSGWSASQKVVVGCQGGQAPAGSVLVALLFFGLLASRRRA